ncbi:MAG: hypothetical protein HYZ28_03210 [Myxococcales bacterium]|nr:hypothetical protein [Myxococcales bacterium]
MELRQPQYRVALDLGAQGAPEESRYRLRFLADGRRRWQNVSLNALASFAPPLVTIGVL